MPAERDPDSLQLFHYYVKVFWARKRIILAVLGLTILAGYVVSRVLPRIYRATCLIQVQPEKPGIDSFSGQKTDQYDENFLRTQFELIQSDQVVEEVVRELKLADHLGREYGCFDETDPSKTFDRTVKLVSSKIKVQQRKDTNLIEISVEIDRPRTPRGQAAVEAARIANAVGEVFRDQTHRRSRDITKRALAELQREIKVLDNQIAEKEQQLNLLRGKYNINSDEDFDGSAIHAQTLQQAKDARSKAEIELQNKRVFLEQVFLLRENKSIRALAILVQSKTLDALVTEWSQLEVQRRAQLNSSLGPEHPRMKRLRARIDELDRRIGEEADAICISLQADYAASRSSYNRLTEMVAQLMNQDNELAQNGYRDFQALTREIKTLRQRRNTWEESYIQERLKLRLPHTAVNIVQKANQNQASSPVSPKVSIILLGSVMFGLLAGFGLVLLLEILNTSIKTADDVKYHLRTQVLGAIPRGVKNLLDPQTFAMHAESYRLLRTNIKSARQGQEGLAVCLTSGGAKEGKSQTLFHLAYVCAKLGDRVLIVDSDLHLPTQHQRLQASRHPGLSNFLLGEASLAEIVQHTHLPNLDLLPAGRPRDESAGLHEVDTLMTALRDLKRRYDWILLDSPPMVGISDTSELVRAADAVVMVVQHRKYPRALLQQVREGIEQLGGNLLGVVLNCVNVSRWDSNSSYRMNGYPQTGRITRSRIKLWPEKQGKRKVGA